MMRAAEIAVPLAVAIGTHLAAFWVWSDHAPGSPPAGGNAGASEVTLAAAPPRMARLAAQWETAPEHMQTAVAMPALEANEGSPVTESTPDGTARVPAPPAPVRPALETLPELPRADPSVPKPAHATQVSEPRPPDAGDVAPRLAALSPAGRLAAPLQTAEAAADLPPIIETAIAVPAARAVALQRPRARPEGLAPQPPQAGQASRKAKGSAAKTPVAGADAATTGTANEDRTAALQAEWRILVLKSLTQSLQRSAARGTGSVGLVLTLTPRGRVQDIKLARSSGDKGLDEAVLRTLLRIGPLPRAPKGLDDPAYLFPVTLNLTR